jgi:hypothetical protein
MRFRLMVHPQYLASQVSTSRTPCPSQTAAAEPAAAAAETPVPSNLVRHQAAASQDEASSGQEKGETQELPEVVEAAGAPAPVSPVCIMVKFSRLSENVFGKNP